VRAASAHRPHLDALALSEDAKDALDQYLDLLSRWNERVNLTGAKTPHERVQMLVAPAAAAAPFLGEGALLDVGSGNGSPGLVLAVLRPGPAATLLEPRKRRWAFLREAARALGRSDIEVLRLRHDEYQGPSAPNVTIRALALPLRELVPLVQAGGRVLVFGAEAVLEDGWVKERDVLVPGSSLRILRRPCFT